MGARNLDRFGPSEWRRHFETAAAMRRARWRVRSVCPVCGVRLRTPLAATIRLHGEAFSLWNRAAPCLVEGCTGQVYYEGWPPKLAGYFRLTAREGP